MNFGSLFTGIGGFDLGLERSGMACSWQVEIDKNCQWLLSQHWPTVEKHSDVRNVGKHNLTAVDLICGGFPCQDLSVAGRRAGLAGERSGLWYEFHRVIAETKPQWVVIENVPGLLSSDGGRDFAAILRGLVELRYGVCWRVLDSQYFGVPQRHRRVFVVGHLGDGRAAQVLFESEGGAGDTPPRREAGQGIAHAVSASPTATGRLDPNGQDFVTGTLQASGAGTSRPAGMASEPDFLVVAHETGKGFWTEGLPGLRSEPGGMPENIVAFSAGQSSQAYGIAADENVTPPIRAGESGTNRVPAIAFSAKDNGRDAGPISPPLVETRGHTSIADQKMGVRRLTPTECEHLQGFPDGWTAGQADSTRYRQLGNAVTVPVIEWIGRRIMETML